MANSNFKETLITMNSGASMSENEFRCVICCQFLRDPVITRCGHRFCCECLNFWLTKKKKKECPLDSIELDLEKDTFPDNFTKRQMAEFVCRCTYKGCPVELPLIQYDDHISSCKYQYNKVENSLMQNCKFMNVGCTYKGTIEEIKTHIEADVCSHSQLLLNQICNLKNDKCENCMPCGCNGKSIDQNKFPFYLNDVYEKMIELDQRTRENFIKLENISTQLNNCLSEIALYKISSPPDLNNGLLTWRLCNFDQMILQMKKNPSMTVYSPIFSTNESGYKFRIRLTLSKTNRDALALILHMVRGESDDSLKWPFVGEISLNILHPTDVNQRINAIMKTDHLSEAFQRPKQDINVCGFGFLETVRILELREQGYLKCNQLTILVSVWSYDYSS